MESKRGRVPIAIMVWGAVALTAMSAPAAPLDVEPAPKYAGRISVDVAKGTSTPRVVTAGDVYANTTTVVGGLSSTDLLAVWGDRVTTTGMGTVDQIDLPIFNSASSAGPLLTANFTITFYDGSVGLPLPTPMGSFSGSANFGAGLNPGFYAMVNLTSLNAYGINLTGTDILMTQTITSFTGTATRLGTVHADPPTVGSSLLPAANTCYVQASTIGGGVAGYYSFTAPAGNAAYRINVGTTPVELSTFTSE